MLDRAAIENATFIVAWEHHAEIGSTNDRAKAIARLDADVALPLLIVADRQTAGRGRGGNRWWTGEQSLAMSLLLDLQAVGLPRQQIGQLALAVGVALAEAVGEMLPGEKVGLHWPNDVFVGEAKLAGILIEAPSRSRAVIGVGVNTNNTAVDAPRELGARRITTMRDLTGQAVCHTTLLVALLQGIEKQLAALKTDASKVMAGANALCSQMGRAITLRQDSVVTTGECKGIAADGALLLRTADGVIRPFYTGTIDPT